MRIELEGKPGTAVVKQFLNNSDRVRKMASGLQTHNTQFSSLIDNKMFSIHFLAKAVEQKRKSNDKTADEILSAAGQTNFLSFINVEKIVKCVFMKFEKFAGFPRSVFRFSKLAKRKRSEKDRNPPPPPTSPPRALIASF